MLVLLRAKWTPSFLFLLLLFELVPQSVLSEEHASVHPSSNGRSLGHVGHRPKPPLKKNSPPNKPPQNGKSISPKDCDSEIITLPVVGYGRKLRSGSPLADGCRFVYLDIGGNVGIQTRSHPMSSTTFHHFIPNSFISYLP